MLLVLRWLLRPLAPWKNMGSRRQHCLAGGCVCPGISLPAHAESALLSPLQLRFASPRGEGPQCLLGAWAGAPSPQMLVPSLPCAQPGGQLC